MVDAELFINDMTGRLTNMPLFVSDELAHYATALAKRYHTVVPVPPTGKRGRPKKPELVIDRQLKYGTVHKERKGGKVVKVRRTVVFGDKDEINKILEQSPSNTINTAFIERSNFNWRQWDAHLTRKSMSFAKEIDYLNAKISICFANYNFIRPHSSLSRVFDSTKGTNKYVPTTPAMAAKITDHPLSFEELLAL